MNHYPTHLAAGIVLIGATLAVGLLTPNRLVRSRLRLSFVLFLAFLGLDAVSVLAAPPQQ